MDALAVMMQDLTQNHILRRQKNDLTNQVRRLLCEKANLLAQVCPPACPVAFPETFTGDTARLPEFLIQAASHMRFFEARFSNDTLKVAFLISYFSGATEEWVVPYIGRESPILSLPGLRGRAETGLWQECLENNRAWTPRVWRDGSEPLLSAQTRPCLALIHKELSRSQLLGPDSCLETLAAACFYHPAAFALRPAT